MELPDMCKSTTSRYSRQYYLDHRSEYINRTRMRELNNPWGVLKSRASAWNKNKTRKNVYRLVHAALKAGFLVRPTECSMCGAADIGRSDGKTMLHAHHRNPSQPLLVDWVCAKCHAKLDSHKWNPIECTLCGRSIRGASAYATHMRWHAA